MFFLVFVKMIILMKENAYQDVVSLVRKTTVNVRVAMTVVVLMVIVVRVKNSVIPQADVNQNTVSVDAVTMKMTNA